MKDSKKKKKRKTTSLKKMVKKYAQKIKKIGVLEQINLDAGGIDVGASEIYVAIPEERSDQFVRKFGTFTQDLGEIVKWFKEHGVTTVALESTGVYWVPLYDLLEQAGIDVYLVDARKTKNVAGRKTDVADCQWIQQLHTYGLLRKAFVPDEQIRNLRTLERQRDMLSGYRSSHIQHMQKAMEEMNLKLTNVLADITGKSGMAIIRSIIAGERDPNQLAKHRDYRCRKSEKEIALSLEGNFNEAKIFVLKQALELYDSYTKLMIELDGESEKIFKSFASKVNEKSKPLKKLARSLENKNKNAPTYDLRSQLYRITGVDLTRVDGFDVLVIQRIISEVGLDMSKWPTVKDFASWLGLAPNNKISGGKILSSATRKTKSRANKAFRMAAMGVGRSNCSIGAFYRKIKAKDGPQSAITATAHKLARIFYVMVSKQVEYSDELVKGNEEKNKKRRIKYLQRGAAQLGYKLVEIDVA
jgi:transposase